MCIMYNKRSGPRNISDDERAALKKALTIYYSEGCPISDAFARLGSGLIDRPHRRKKKHPEEIEEIDAEAQVSALKSRSSQQVVLDAELQRKSWELQRQAAEALMSGWQEMVSSRAERDLNLPARKLHCCCMCLFHPQRGT
jgi:hypothetical protein